MALNNPIDRQSYPLDKDFKIGDLTFDLVGRFEKTSDSTYLPGKQIITFSLGEQVSLQESVYIDVSTAPTTVDAARGVYRYTIAQASDRGLDSDNTSSTALNSQTANQKKHAAGRQVGVVISAIYQAELQSTFEAGGVTTTATTGENITALDTVSLHTDGKVYKYLFATYPNLVGVANATVASGLTLTYTTYGGLSTGHAGLTIGSNEFAEDTGAIAEVASATTTILGTAETATTIRIAKAGVAVNEYSDSLFRINDDVDPTKQIDFQASGITTGTTRTITMPDANVDLSDIETLFTLGENLTAADVVRAYNDGGTTKVVRVNGITAQAVVAGPRNNIVSPRVAYSTTDDRFLVVYYDATNTQGEAVVAKIAGDTLTFGTPAVFDTNPSGGSSHAADVSWDSGVNKFLIAYYDSTDTLGEAIVATIATGDDSVTFGAASTFNPAAVDFVNVKYDSNAAKHLMVYADQGGTGQTESKVATISGTGVTFGVVTQIDADINSTDIALAFDSNENKFLVSYYDVGVTNQTLTIGTISGTTVSYAGATIFGSNITNLDANDMAFDSLNNVFLHVGYSASAGWGAVATAISLASGGASLTIQGQACLDGSPTGSTQMGVAYNSIQNKFLISWEDGASTLSMCDAKIINGMVKIGETIKGIALVDTAVACNNLVGNDKFLVVYDGASGLDGHVVESDSRDQACGILQTTGSAGDIKNVKLWGSISGAHSSLSVGMQQWISSAGVATAKATGYPLGIATSATDILTNRTDPLGHRVCSGVTYILNAAVTVIQHGLGKVPSKIMIYPQGARAVTAASDEGTVLLVGNPSARGFASLFDDVDTDLGTTVAGGNSIYKVTETTFTFNPDGTTLDGDWFWTAEG